jgi:release factor glutamine methyltransferase
VDDELYRELLQELSGKLAALPDKPDETAESTLHALWCSAAGEPMSVDLAATMPRPRLDEMGAQTLRLLVEKRVRGTPLAYITGRQQFMGVEFVVGPGALVPRKETEILGRAALAKLQEAVLLRGSAVVIDVCCGAGNLALSLARHAPAARVFAADISPGAIQLTHANIERLGLSERITARQGDLLQPFDTQEFHGQVDLLTCNPPYIPSAKVDSMHEEIRAHEPREAFDGGPFGIRIVQRLARDAVRFLRADGWLAFELGLGQGGPIIQRMRKEGLYRELVEVHDGDGRIRAILAKL